MGAENRGLLIALAVLVLAILVLPLLGGAMMGPGMMGPGMMWGYGAQGTPSGASGWAWGLGVGLGWLVMLAFWGALIAGVVFLVRGLTGTATRSGDTAGKSALDILRRRYAAGEITREEYEQMKEVLQR